MANTFLIPDGNFAYKDLLFKSLEKGDFKKINKFIKLGILIPLKDG